jgi:hypothetical protein
MPQQTASLVLSADDWDTLLHIQYEYERNNFALNVRANIATRDERLCLMTADGAIVGMCLVSSGGYSGDLDRRVELRSVRHLDEPVNWQDLIERLPGTTARHAVEASQTTRLIPDRTASSVVEALRAATSEADRIYTDLIGQRRVYRQRPLSPVAQLREEQRDAVALALRAAGLDPARLLRAEPEESTSSFLSDVTADAAPASEAAIIRLDFQRFAGWIPDDGKLHDAVEFRDPNNPSRRVEVFYADKEALELATGTDLIYHRVYEQGWILVQYKRMKVESSRKSGEQWVYRSDEQLNIELERMRRIPASTPGPEAADWRLNAEPFYIKLVRDQTAKPHDRSLLSAYGLTCRLGYELTCWSRRGDHGMASPVPATSDMRSLSR